MRKKNVTAFLASIMMVLSLGACGQSGSTAVSATQKTSSASAGASQAQSTAKQNGKKKTLAVLPFSMSQEFGADMVGAVQTAAKDNYEVTVLDPNFDLPTQVSMIEDLVVQGVDGIIFSAIDTTSMGTLVDKVKAAGIKIIDYDCTVAEGNTDASIRSDDQEGGRLAAEILMNKVKDDHATIIVYGTASTIGTGYLRNTGFKKYMQEKYPDVTIIETRPSEGAGTRDGCRAWAVDMVTAYPEAKGFFTFYGDGAIGTYYGLQEAGRTDITLVGYDATEEQKKIMENDGPQCILTASIAQYPNKMGEMAVDIMGKLFDGAYTRKGPEDVLYITPGVLQANDVKNFK